ncbi:MAG: hypothetical protein ACI9PP_002371, partial [Halobacteriales archaeon]
TELRERLPKECVPLRMAPGVGIVVLAGVDYRDVGGFEPYEEFAVLVPCVRDGRDLPLVGAMSGEVGASVDFLPVTTEASVALGREIWGYPKVVADIKFDRRPGGHLITLRRDGRLICRLETPRGRPRGRTTTAKSYTTKGGQTIRTSIEIDGPFTVRPFDPRVRVECGPAEYGQWLADLLVTRRSIATLNARRVGGRLHPGKPM